MLLLEKLHEIDGFLERAEKTAIRLVDKVHAKERESMVNAALPSMRWYPGDMGERRKSYINGDSRPLHLTRMTVEVTEVSQTTLLEVRAMFKNPLGWAGLPTAGGAANTVIRAFDFDWNFSVGRRESYYSRAAYASSQLLAGQERGQFLEFKTEITLNPGESLEGVVRPTSIHLPVLSTRNIVSVKLKFDGYRG